MIRSDQRMRLHLVTYADKIDVIGCTAAENTSGSYFSFETAVDSRPAERLDGGCVVPRRKEVCWLFLDVDMFQR